MFNCKIGIVARKRDNTSSFIYLGEIFMSEMRNNVQCLFEIHSYLRFLCSFRAFYKGDKVCIDNMEDIYTLQEKYKLTKRIYITEPKEKGVLKYFAPELYDISCMIPLFQESVPRYNFINRQGVSDDMFILLPYLDPIIRGKIADSCMNTLKDRPGIFVCVGGKQKQNIMKVGDLYRRYLLSCGVNSEDIIIHEYDELPDLIIDVLTILDMITEKSTRVFIGVDRRDMSDILNYIRVSRAMGLITRKIQFICD
jgi:hypothetical protein